MRHSRISKLLACFPHDWVCVTHSVWHDPRRQIARLHCKLMHMSMAWVGYSVFGCTCVGTMRRRG